MFSKVIKYLIPHLTVEDPGIHVRGLPANHVYGCHVTLVTHVVREYAPYQKGVIQGHPGHRRPTGEDLDLCCWIVFSAVYSLDVTSQAVFPLQWCHNDHDGVSNHQPHDCLLNRLFRRRSKKTSKLRVTGLCVGNSPGPVNSPHKGPITRKRCPFDDVIMSILHVRKVSFKGYFLTFSSLF